jgi:tetratricopeptide (TPR) repeat protein
MRYSAFISYNHRDRDWAVWLHRALERYRVPKRLRGRPAPWGEIGARLPPVFRDRDELATSADLAASVKEALNDAATLVVICSPNGARSKWVDQEIRTFTASGRAAYIRLIIVDGEPHSSDAAKECLPPSLTANGAPEPLAADARKEGDGKQGAKLKILAGILGVPYDELRQREAARRQKRLVAIAAAASVGFILMAGLTIFAFVSRGEAIKQRKLTEERTVTAERTVDFVKSMFQLADPSEARGASITAREIVDRGVQKLDSPTLAREPLVKAELGITLADVYGALGLYRQSDALIRRTFSIHHGEPATLARQLTALGDSQFRLGDYDRADATYRQAWVQGAQASDAVRSKILLGLGLSETDLGQAASGRKFLSEALQIDRGRGESAGSDLARDLEALGLNRFTAGDLDGAKPYIQQAIALRRRFEGPDSPSIADNLNTLGSIAYTQQDLPAAQRYFSGNVAVYRKLLGPDHPDLATAMNNLARVLIEERRFAEAAPLLEHARRIDEPQRGAADPQMAFVYSNLAIVRRHTGNLQEAEELFKKAIAAARASKHRTLGPSLADLAEVRCANGRAVEGLAMLDEAARVTRGDYPDKPWRSAWVENVRGECLLRAGKTAEGRKAITASSPVIIKSLPAGTLFPTEAQERLKRAGAI